MCALLDYVYKYVCTTITMYCIYIQEELACRISSSVALCRDWPEKKEASDDRLAPAPAESLVWPCELGEGGRGGGEGEMVAV